MKNPRELEEQYGAHNYLPLPVTLVKGQGIFLWDDQGKKYLDMMSAYSAVSHGHSHPDIVKTVKSQVETLNVTSRAFFNNQLGPFLQRACEISGMDLAVPMNTGAEAVETAVKVCRKWAYVEKGIPKDQAEIIVCANNFHGRTTTIISFSTEKQYREYFGPHTPGFVFIPFGDANALSAAITPHTCAFLVEPIQGEAGIILPPTGYLKQCEAICKANNVMLILDEVQTGLGRTGKLFAFQHESVNPDGLILGKALGGGVLPVSLFLGKKNLLQVLRPGDHGSTFGGNALAAAIGHKGLDILIEEKLVENSAEMGKYFLATLKKINSKLIKDIRGIGLFIAVEINPKFASAREVCLKLMQHGLLSKETHETVVRLAPPLIINQLQIDQAVGIIRDVLENW